MFYLIPPYNFYHSINKQPVILTIIICRHASEIFHSLLHNRIFVQVRVLKWIINKK